MSPPTVPLLSVPKDSGLRAPLNPSFVSPKNLCLRLPPPCEPGDQAPAPRSLKSGVWPLYLLLLRTHHAAATAATYPAPHIPFPNPNTRSALDKPDRPPSQPRLGRGEVGGRGVSETREREAGRRAGQEFLAENARGGVGGSGGVQETQRGSVRDEGGDTPTQRGSKDLGGGQTLRVRGEDKPKSGAGRGRPESCGGGTGP